MGVAQSSLWKLLNEGVTENAQQVDKESGSAEEEICKTETLNSVQDNAACKEVEEGCDLACTIANVESLIEAVELISHFFDAVEAFDVGKSFLQSCRKDIAAKDFSSCHYSMYYRDRIDDQLVQEYGIFFIQKLPDKPYKYFHVSTKSVSATLPFSANVDGKSALPRAAFEKEFYNGRKINQQAPEDPEFRFLRVATESRLSSKMQERGVKIT